MQRLRRDSRGHHFNAKAGRRAKITSVESHDTRNSGRDCQFQDHVVIRIRQAGAPQEIDGLVLGQRAQIVENGLDLEVSKIQYRLISLEYVFVFEQQGRRKCDRDFARRDSPQQLVRLAAGGIEPGIENIGIEYDPGRRDFHGPYREVGG